MILYQHDHAVMFRFQVLGELLESSVAELEGCWITARPTIGHRQVIVDLAGVTRWDDAAVAVLSRMREDGATLTGSAELLRLVAGESVGRAIPPAQLASQVQPRLSRWLPVRFKAAE